MYVCVYWGMEEKEKDYMRDTLREEVIKKELTGKVVDSEVGGDVYCVNNVQRPKESIVSMGAKEEYREVLKGVSEEVKEYERVNRTTYVYLTYETYLKMEVGYSMGCSDNEVASLCKITRKKLGRIFEKYPKVLELVEIWKGLATLEAKKVIMEEIKGGNVNVAKWYLEKRASDEFSNKVQVEHKGVKEMNVNVSMTRDRLEAIREKIPLRLEGIDGGVKKVGGDGEVIEL